MKKAAPIILLFILTLLALLIFRQRKDSDIRGTHQEPTPKSNVGSVTQQDKTTRPTKGDTPTHEAGTSAKARPPKPSAVAKDEIFTASVHAEIEAGETLVMGGYRKPDGSHEFTFLTPTVVTLEDGRELIQLRSRVLAVGPEFAKSSGMDSLATPAPNTEDSSEAWSQADTLATLRSASESQGAAIMNSPNISITSGETFGLNFGNQNLGGASYSIGGTVTRNNTGGFSIEANTERTPPGED